MFFMNSVDTNILIYAVNSGCEEHARALAVYEKMLESPTSWIISDQVLFEFYRGLRHSKILEKPLTHKQALEQIIFLREESGVSHCAYETSFWEQIKSPSRVAKFSGRQIFDQVLAVTLLKNKVETLYTRNLKDFRAFGFQALINPID